MRTGESWQQLGQGLLITKQAFPAEAQTVNISGFVSHIVFDVYSLCHFSLQAATDHERTERYLQKYRAGWICSTASSLPTFAIKAWW